MGEKGSHLIAVLGRGVWWATAHGTSVRRGKVASLLPSHPRDWREPLMGEGVRPWTYEGKKKTSLSLSLRSTSVSWKLESHRYRGIASLSLETSIVFMETEKKHRYLGNTLLSCYRIVIVETHIVSLSWKLASLSLKLASLPWNHIVIVESHRYLRRAHRNYRYLFIYLFIYLL